MSPKPQLSNHGPEDAATMADDFPSPDPGHGTIAEQMDIQNELANQAAAEAVAAAVVAEARATEEAASRARATVNTSSSQAHTKIPQPGQGPPVPPTFRRARPSTSTQQSPSFQTPYNTAPVQRQAQTPETQLSNSEQIQILRNFYAINPTPNKRELEQLARETGRHWIKIREYFRQRRNKLRGFGDLEAMDEPSRAMGWLQVAYRSAPPTSHVSQLTLYNSYKTRFDPYTTSTPLLGGQELIQLACATFSGCEMARDEGDYVLKGLREKEGTQGETTSEGEIWEKGIEGLVEPLRASSWLLNSFQHQSDPLASNITQTDLYTSYATRFSTFLPDNEHDSHNVSSTTQQQQDDDELKDFENNMAGPVPSNDDDLMNPSNEMTSQELTSLGLSATPLHPETDDHPDIPSLNASNEETGDNPSVLPEQRENRLLNPVELITLTRMTFPKCEPIIDNEGRFVIKGLERREGVEKGRGMNGRGDMFPFALATAPDPSNPNHPFTSILKRKLALLTPDPDGSSDPKRSRTNGAGSSYTGELANEEKELVDGLKRFKGSRLGQAVRDVCVSQ